MSMMNAKSQVLRHLAPLRLSQGSLLKTSRTMRISRQITRSHMTESKTTRPIPRYGTYTEMRKDHERGAKALLRRPNNACESTTLIASKVTAQMQMHYEHTASLIFELLEQQKQLKRQIEQMSIPEYFPHAKQMRATVSTPTGKPQHTTISAPGEHISAPFAKLGSLENVAHLSVTDPDVQTPSYGKSAVGLTGDGVTSRASDLTSQHHNHPDVGERLSYDRERSKVSRDEVGFWDAIVVLALVAGLIISIVLIAEALHTPRHRECNCGSSLQTQESSGTARSREQTAGSRAAVLR